MLCNTTTYALHGLDTIQFIENPTENRLEYWSHLCKSALSLK